MPCPDDETDHPPLDGSVPALAAKPSVPLGSRWVCPLRRSLVWLPSEMEPSRHAAPGRWGSQRRAPLPWDPTAPVRHHSPAPYRSAQKVGRSSDRAAPNTVRSPDLTAPSRGRSWDRAAVVPEEQVYSAGLRSAAVVAEALAGRRPDSTSAAERRLDEPQVTRSERAMVRRPSDEGDWVVGRLWGPIAPVAGRA